MEPFKRATLRQQLASDLALGEHAPRNTPSRCPTCRSECSDGPWLSIGA